MSESSAFTTGDNVDDAPEELAHWLDAYTEDKTRRLQDHSSHFSNDYRHLVNGAISDLASPTHATDLNEGAPLEASQVGATVWLPHEKDLFFAKLASVGRDDTRAIATAIGSKSEYEVAEYVDVFTNAWREIADRQASLKRRILATADLPAALEIDGQCEIKLDKAAEALEWFVERADRRTERDRHGDHWLLDHSVAETVEDVLAHRDRPALREQDNAEAEDGSHHIANPVKAAELLHLRNWLDVSRVLTCYNDDFADTWAFNGHCPTRPSMFHTAFNDFHNLATSLTKRLVQASIFQATSRIRALDVDARRSRTDEIRHQDVYAAVEVLGLKNDWHKFWIGCARRNRLKVITRERGRSGRGHGRGSALLSYDDVEQALRRYDNVGDRTDRPADDVAAVVSTEADPSSTPLDNDLDLDSDSDFWTDDEGQTGEQLDNGGYTDSEAASQVAEISDPDPLYMSHGRGKAIAMARQKREDDNMELLDQRASALETARLWRMMKCDPPTESIKDGRLPQLSRLPPKRQREDADGLIDWRDRTNYCAEWETFGQPVGAEQFRRVGIDGQRAKRRRLEAISRMQRRQDAEQDSQLDTTAPVSDAGSPRGDVDLDQSESASDYSSSRDETTSTGSEL